MFLFSVKYQRLQTDVQWRLEHYVSGHSMGRLHCPRGKAPVATRQEAGWDMETVSSDGEISQHLLKRNPDSLVVQLCPGLLSRSKLHLYVTRGLGILLTKNVYLPA